MCDSCKIKNLDYKFRNKTAQTKINFLSNVFVNSKAKVNLCKLCEIELFQKGEAGFLKDNIALAIEMSLNKQKYSANC